MSPQVMVWWYCICKDKSKTWLKIEHWNAALWKGVLEVGLQTSASYTVGHCWLKKDILLLHLLNILGAMATRLSNNNHKEYTMLKTQFYLTTHSVSRHKQRFVSGAQLVKKSIGQFLTAGPQFTYRGVHTVSIISVELTTTDQHSNTNVDSFTDRLQDKVCRGLIRIQKTTKKRWREVILFSVSTVNSGSVTHSLTPTIGECVNRLASVVKCCQTGTLGLSRTPPL